MVKMAELANAVLPYVEKLGGWFVLSIVLMFVYWHEHVKERRSNGERVGNLVDVIKQNADANGKTAAALVKLADHVDSAQRCYEDGISKMAKSVDRMQEFMLESELRRQQELTSILTRRGGQ